MRTVQHYWEPSPYEASGHSAVTLDPGGRNLFVAFWAILPDKTEGAACAAYFNKDFGTDCRVIGLRKMMHSYFQQNPNDLPSGIGIYLTLITALKEETTVDKVRKRLLNWKKEDRFAAITPKEMSQHEKNQVEIFCQFISDYINTTKALVDLLRDSLTEGKPTESVEIPDLNVPAMITELDKFEANAPNMRWAAKVGSETDCNLSAPHWNRVNFVAQLPFSSFFPGIQGYKKGIIRHNCSSFNLALLQKGGIDLRLEGFVENPAERLAEIIKQREDSVASRAAKLKKITLIRWLPAFSMAHHCGATPCELNMMCKYARNHGLNSVFMCN